MQSIFHKLPEDFLCKGSPSFIGINGTYCYQTRLHIKSTSSETHLLKIVHSNQ